MVENRSGQKIRKNQKKLNNSIFFLGKTEFRQKPENLHLCYRNVSDVVHVQLGINCRETMAAERLLVTPVSTAECERVFSRQNLIKNSHRNRLGVDSLDNLIRLSLCDFEIDLNAAFNHWAKVRNRRILQRY